VVEASSGEVCYEGCLGKYGTLLVTITMGAWHDVCKTSVRVYGRIRFTAFTRRRNEPLNVCMCDMNFSLYQYT